MKKRKEEWRQWKAGDIGRRCLVTLHKARRSERLVQSVRPVRDDGCFPSH